MSPTSIVRFRSRRRGSILPLIAVSLVGLCGFAALAVDIGMVAVAKSQAQNAADAAALAAARTFDGSAADFLSTATTNARNVAQANPILAQTLRADEINLQHGSYHYDSSSHAFVPQFPPVAPDTYDLCKATVTHQAKTAFASVVGIPNFTITATATAAHRPRDVAIILDVSGPMNNESDLWNNESYLGGVNNSPNNKGPIFPRFGHYSDISNAALQCTSTDPRVGKCNITAPILGMSAMVNDDYQHGRGVTSSSPAFTPVAYDTSLYYAASSAGDRYLMKSGSTTTPAKTIEEATGKTVSAITVLPSYTGNAGNPFGYTLGPGYWGKTFFIWPPDLRSAYDWRQWFLGTSDDRKLWDTSGNWLDPSGNYTINDVAILSWIKSKPNPFPTQLRAGRVLYYDAIPDDVPSSAYTHERQSPDHRSKQAFLEGIHRLRHRGLARSIREHSEPGLPLVQLRPGLRLGHGQGQRALSFHRPEPRCHLGPLPGQPQAAPPSVLVRPDDHGPVHFRHETPAQLRARHLDVRRQARNRRRLAGHPRQPPERSGGDHLLQSATVQQ